jgi:7,8-dihydroneopterin aldolase/epimerase/oxygenase
VRTVVELHGLEVFGRHGVGEEERLVGQRFLFDVWLEVSEPSADRIDEAVDYREVAGCVRTVSDGNRFQLLESLAGAVAEELVSRFPVERVRVRVRKPEVKLDPPAEYSAATAERP